MNQAEGPPYPNGWGGDGGEGEGECEREFECEGVSVRVRLMLSVGEGEVTVAWCHNSTTTASKVVVARRLNACTDLRARGTARH